MSQQKTVVVTGASRGIGLATALLFVQRGWRVISCARGPAPPEMNSAAGMGSWTQHFCADLADAASTEALLKKIIAALGDEPLHALVNNAGMSPKQPNRERLGALNGDIDAWHDVFELNFFAPLKLGRGLARPLAKAHGAIVNVTSIAGHMIHPFAGSAYSCSKAALSALTREMANEFAAINVRVNAVAPGEIATAMIQPEYEMLIPRIPLNRMGTPEDVARTIYYLCSDESAYVTGSEVWVTGGQHMF
jgi:NAD(P)-dependent dehydrogenase (short-subunit alcohol dehydrogenase family)